MPKVITWDESMKSVGDESWSLLLGNGFSARYFSYHSLLEKAALRADDPPRILFDRLKTVDFERIVRTLEGAALVAAAYGNNKHETQLLNDAGRVREALVHAIRGTHPSHREDIEDVIASCVDFLSPFSQVFTLNYDLLLNWVSQISRY